MLQNDERTRACPARPETINAGGLKLPNRKKKGNAPVQKNETGNNRALLQNLLKDYPENEIEEVARYLDNIPADKHGDKSYIYRHLIRKFKSEKGLAIYTLIKKDLEKYYRH